MVRLSFLVVNVEILPDIEREYSVKNIGHLGKFRAYVNDDVCWEIRHIEKHASQFLILQFFTMDESFLIVLA